MSGKNSMISNNVIRLLESRKIQFKAVDLPAEKLGALETADFLSVDPGLVYKTIVIQREKSGKPLLAVVPGDQRVDLKSLAAFINEKKVSIPTEKDAEQLTGLQVGGISALALMNRGFETLLDLSAMKLTDFYVSGGMRGLLIWMQVQDFVTISGARFAPLIKIGD
jgi:Cys-tRNA(Pro)/Cys-tRNA(Cys) deacylase